MLVAPAPLPGFFLTDLHGERQDIGKVRNGAPLLLAIYRSSCPVCQMTLPFLDRISTGSLPVIAISQDDERDTERFVKKYHLNLPVLLDRAEDRYPASNALGITNVPSLFLVEADGGVSLAATGFQKADLEALGQRSGVQVFRPDDNVPQWRAG